MDRETASLGLGTSVAETSKYLLDKEIMMRYDKGALKKI